MITDHLLFEGKNVPEGSRMFQKVPECSRRFQNVPEGFRMHADPWACMQISDPWACMQAGPWVCMPLHKLVCSYISLRVHEFASSSLSLHEVPWAYVKFHELACSFMSLYAVPFFVWAAHKNFDVLVNFTVIQIYNINHNITYLEGHSQLLTQKRKMVLKMILLMMNIKVEKTIKRERTGIHLPLN